MANKAQNSERETKKQKVNLTVAKAQQRAKHVSEVKGKTGQRSGRPAGQTAKPMVINLQRAVDKARRTSAVNSNINVTRDGRANRREQ
jgi:hypothetical protein